MPWDQSQTETQLGSSPPHQFPDGEKVFVKNQGSLSSALVTLLWLALLYSIRHYTTLPWHYYTLIESTAFYHSSTSFYFPLQCSTTVLIQST